MKYLTILSLLFSMTLNSCAQSSETQKVPSQVFWDALTARCGKTYEGYITQGSRIGDGFTGERLIMHIRQCDDDKIYIPFNVGENRSRTWILHKDSLGLIQLKHDHRHEDGTDDEITMYGGKSNSIGVKHIQVFPADEATQKMIPAAATNVWWMTIDDTTFSYNLRRLGTERAFKVVFDLTKELTTPKASWGWEGK